MIFERKKYWMNLSQDVETVIQKQIGAGCLCRSDTLLSEKAKPKSHSFARLCQTPQSIQYIEELS